MAFTVDASVLNISRSGIAVQTKFQLVVGRKYAVQIGYRSGPVLTTGTVRRCSLRRTRRTEKGEVEPIYEAGIEFDDVLNEKQAEIMPIVAKSASLQLKPRLYGRFRPDEDETVTLKSDLDFEVRRISLSGLLVETESAPEPDAVVSIEIQIDGRPFASAGRIANVSKVSDEEGAHKSQFGVEFLKLSDEQRKLLETFLLGQIEGEFWL